MPRGRPKNSARTVDKGAFVRMSSAELELLRQAVARELEGVTGATPSVPKFMLAAALDKARKVLGQK
jgi:uncharacterized protein (DUF1778 family)